MSQNGFQVSFRVDESLYRLLKQDAAASGSESPSIHARQVLRHALRDNGNSAVQQLAEEMGEALQQMQQAIEEVRRHVDLSLLAILMNLSPDQSESELRKTVARIFRK